MKKLLSFLSLCFASLLVGCGGDDGSFAGTWISENGFFHYVMTPQDDGYKVKSKRKVSNGEMIDGRQMFFKREGSYLTLDNDKHFLEVINDRELKLTSSGMIFKKEDEK